MSKNPDGSDVGPRNPPFEHRWRKGQPSPNPSGRPSKKKRFTDTFASLEPHLSRIIEFDQKIITHDADGTPITRGDSIDSAFSQMSLRDFKALELYLRRRDEAFRLRSEFKQRMLVAAANHIDTHLVNVLALERMGKEAKVLPHPLDVIIEPDSVRIVGPTTEIERLAMKEAIKQRDLLHNIAKEHLSGGPASLTARQEIWKKLRRRHYRLQRLIPPRLRAAFPDIPRK